MTDPTPSSPGVHFPPPVPFVLILLAGWLLNRYSALPIVPSGRGIGQTAIGWLIFCSGVAGLAWAMSTFVHAKTAIFPNRPATTIVMRGPYRYSRNPMYVSLSLLVSGSAVLMNSFWPILLLPLAIGFVFVYVVRREERYLKAAFGEAYAAYCRQVRRWL